MANLLIVDDDDDLGETLQEVFAMHGHTADLVSNGKDALAKLNAVTFDLVILDWELPGISGLEVCSTYRASGGLDLVLLLTGRRDADSLETGRRAGATDFLTKPFSLDQLIERVNRILEQRTHT